MNPFSLCCKAAVQHLSHEAQGKHSA